jgi:hypothetical protein
MNGQRDTHGGFPELVAGHALHALEPEDEQTLLKHLNACDRCTRELAAAREVLGQLAYAAEPVDPPAGLFAKIRAEIEVTDPGAFDEPSTAPVVDLDAAREHREQRRRFAQAGPAARWLAGAAAAVVLVVGGLVAWNVSLVHDRDASGQESAALSAAVKVLETTPGRTVPLKDSTTQKVSVVAVMHDTTVSLVIDGLAKNDTATSTYVLWGRDGAGVPYGLTSFDVTDGGVSVVRDAAMSATAVPDTLMITKESGRSIPTIPLNPVLLSGRSA